MDIVIPLFGRFEPLDAIGPYEILAYGPGATVRCVTDTEGSPAVGSDSIGGMSAASCAAACAAVTRTLR
ncbi:hypothetical protein [Streptomyces sp. NPDC048295]|uniref:hypothetical protein n=1 Tax=Streptomyces sp. NPDC048295 TaxID=3154617 RepID=UPI003428989B